MDGPFITVRKVVQEIIDPDELTMPTRTSAGCRFESACAFKDAVAL